MPLRDSVQAAMNTLQVCTDEVMQARSDAFWQVDLETEHWLALALDDLRGAMRLAGAASKSLGMLDSQEQRS